MLKNHCAKCEGLRAVREKLLDSPWYLKDTVKKEAIGRFKVDPTTNWMLLGCDSINCTAEMLAQESCKLSELPHQ